MKQFEVELRALITEEQYNQLKKHFDTISKGDLNDMETYAFLTKERNIKIKKQIQKNKAKMVLKDGPEYMQQTNEYELSLDPSEVQKAIAFITALGYDRHIPSFQKRIDYNIGEITVSLKDETHWRHHVEAEIVVHEKSKIPEARKKLEEFFRQYTLVALTEEQGRALTNAALKKHGIKLI
jgi:adenylate cyclase class IV